MDAITNTIYTELALSSQTLLTIDEFIKYTNYPIDSLYVDKFWHSLGSENQELIYVDDELIKWLGYDAKTAKGRKMGFSKIIDKKSKGFVMKYNNSEYTNFLKNRKLVIWSTIVDQIYPTPLVGKGTGTTVHLLVSPDKLKWIMMNVYIKKDS